MGVFGFDFFSVSVTKREKRGKVRQTPCFFCAAVKRCFSRPLDFELKRENHRTHQESPYRSFQETRFYQPRKQGHDLLADAAWNAASAHCRVPLRDPTSLSMRAGRSAANRIGARTVTNCTTLA
jgi:hypothetical protein